MWLKQIALFAILYFALVQLATSQSVENYRFVVEKKVILDKQTGFYKGASFEFDYKRIYKNKYTFSERGVFGSGKRTSDTFKILNKEWFLLVDGKWLLFYSNLHTVRPKVRMANELFEFIPVGKEVYNDQKCIIYRASPIGGVLSEKLYYWFSPCLGIIKIETNEVKLVRVKIGSVSK